MLSYFKKADWVLISCVLILVGFGLLSIYSSSGGSDFLNFKKQLIFFGVGISLMIVISFSDWKLFSQDPYLILFLYLISLISLGGLLIFAPEIRGVESWYKIGPVSIDPVEPLKVILIILLAKFFSRRHVEMYRVKHILLSGLYVLLPSLLIFFQPDLGSIIVIGLLWGLVLIFSGIKLRHFLILVLVALLILTLGWNILLEDYQKQRVMSFLSPHLEPLGAGWSRTQAKIAVGAGGLLGKGLGQGPQTQYGFLPEPQTDFIFAAIGEEFGFLGIGVLLVTFGILLGRILQIGIKSDSNFPRLFCAGFASLLLVEAFINIGMNLGLLPIIGIPLPLVSYGGSSLIMTLAGLGIVLSMKDN